MGLTPTIRSGINLRDQDLKLSLKASGTWALRTTMNSIPPSGSSMTLFMPTARRWYAKGSQTGCSSETLETDKGYDEFAPIGIYRIARKPQTGRIRSCGATLRLGQAWLWRSLTPMPWNDLKPF